jgi:hypothetical protein
VVHCGAGLDPANDRLVRTGKAQTKHMFSGLPQTADIEVRDCHVSVGP